MDFMKLITIEPDKRSGKPCIRGLQMTVQGVLEYRAGGTVVLTTHDTDEVEKVCDRVGIVGQGKLVALDSPMALTTAHTERPAGVVTADGTPTT